MSMVGQMAREKRAATLRYLEEMALLELAERESVPLGQMLMYMQTLTREDPLISWALSSLLDEGRISQDSTHVLRSTTN